MNAAQLISGIVLGLAGAMVMSSPKIRAHLVAPFDSKPEISLYQMVKDPKAAAEYKIAACNWAKREMYRNPSFTLEAFTEGTCKRQQ